jgi:hypothetical protein
MINVLPAQSGSMPYFAENPNIARLLRIRNNVAHQAAEKREITGATLAEERQIGSATNWKRYRTTGSTSPANEPVEEIVPADNRA